MAHQRNPDHAVNVRERMRHTAFHRYARRGDYARYWNLANISLEPWTEDREWRRNELP